MKKHNKKLTELLVQRRALCDKMTHGVPGCSTDCKLFALRATARACRDSVLEDPAWDNLERVKVTIICEAMALVLSGEYEEAGA